MWRFNTQKVNQNVTINDAGWVAYKVSKQEDLLRLVTASFFNDPYYRKASDDLERLKNLVRDLIIEDPAFILGLAEKVRNEFHMRTMTHILVGETLKYIKWDKFNVKDYIKDSIVRVDDMTEIVSYLLPEWKSNKKARKWALSHWLVKWLREVLGYKVDWKEIEWKFDEYQLAKYNKTDKEINLKDLVRLSHSNSTLSEKILNDKLSTPLTWEVELSKIKKDDIKGRLKVWHNLFDTNKMPYMALLRNLRNIIEDSSKVNDDNLINKVLKLLTNENAVRKSRQLPFRFLSAYKEIEKVNSLYTSEVLDWIQVAATVSVKNLSLDWSLAVFADVSWSMEWKLSDRGTVAYKDIALLFGWMAKVMNKRSVAWIFWDTAKLKNITWNSVFDLYMKYREWEVWYSTFWHKSIELLDEENINVDKIFLFTDEEMYSDRESYGWGSKWVKVKSEIDKALLKYRKKVWKEVKVYIFNLAGWNTTVSSQNNVYTISWWSDKVFDYIDYIDNYNWNTIINEVRENWKKYIK